MISALMGTGLLALLTHLRVQSSYSTQPSDQMSDLKV